MNVRPNRSHSSSAFRQASDFAGGPERLSQRPPHAQHIDWHALYPQDVILHGPTDKKEVALTFDDGPDTTWTPRIASILNTFGIRATFMCVGTRVLQNPGILLDLVQKGHVVGNHSWNHPNFTQISATEVQQQIERTTEEIARIAGVRPRLFRPPYGALDEQVIDEVRALNDKIVFWNVDSLDWSGITATQVRANVLAHTEPGSIILFHSAGGRGESLEDTVEALPGIIRTLRGEGFVFKTVPDLVNTPAYQ